MRPKKSRETIMPIHSLKGIIESSDAEPERVEAARALRDIVSQKEPAPDEDWPIRPVSDRDRNEARKAAQIGIKDTSAAVKQVCSEILKMAEK